METLSSMPAGDIEQYHLLRETGIGFVVAKHRNGPTGTISLRFRRELVRFENLALAGDVPDDYGPGHRY